MLLASPRVPRPSPNSSSKGSGTPRCSAPPTDVEGHCSLSLLLSMLGPQALYFSVVACVTYRPGCQLCLAANPICCYPPLPSSAARLLSAAHPCHLSTGHL